MNIERINNWFGRKADNVIRFRWLYLIGFVILFVLGFSGLKRMNMSTSWDDYFLEDDPILVKTDEFKEIFGNDNFIAVLTRCENTFTKSNLELIRQLTDELLDSVYYSDKTISLTDIEFLVGTEEGMSIEQIVPDPIPSAPEELEKIKKKAYFKKDIAKRLVSKDGKLSWILLKLKPFPPDSIWRKKGSQSPEMRAGEEAHRIITKDKYSPIAPLGTGMPHLAYRKMRWVAGEFPRVIGLAALLAAIVLALITRSLRGVLVPIFTSIASIIIVYGILGYTGYKIDSGMVSVPVLVAFAVAIAYNIHILAYFKRQFNLHGVRMKAVKETIAEMGWPVLFSALTTLTALLSFLAIPVIPLHFIGIATSGSILITFFIVITIMPILLSFGKNKKPRPEIVEKGGNRLDAYLMKMGTKVLKNGKPIICISILVAIFLTIGAFKIETAFDVENTMGREIPYVNDLLTVAKSELGSMYAYDVLIEFPENDMAKRPVNMMKLDSLSDFVSQFPLTKRITSINDIMKDLNRTLNENREELYKIPENAEQVAQMLLLYENAGGSESEYWIDYDYKRLRLMVELENYNSNQAEKELAEVTGFARKLYPEAKVTTVGSLPQFTAMMQYVVRGQIYSFGIALIIISILLMIVFGSFRIGLIGIIPNIAPAITVGGIMGWFGLPLDMMTATIIPMILGLAVDDTIHFINHGHLEFNRAGNYSQAIRRAFFVVGAPLILTSVVISANFSVYMTSNGNSMVNMGILSVAGMLSALLADLLITPVLFQKFQLFGKENQNSLS